MTLAQELVKRMAGLAGKLTYTNDGRRNNVLAYMAGDCSSVINAILADMGLATIGERSYNIAANTRLTTIASGTRVSGAALRELQAKLKPGDIICTGWETGYYHPSGFSHVDVYAGQGMIWHHGGTDKGTKRQTLASRLATTRVFKVKRIPWLQGTGSKKVKTVTEMANEVIAGKHGNGHAQRQKSLGVDAATYAKVRATINNRAANKMNTRSVSDMAKEVMAGKHGNGHAQRQKSLGLSVTDYAKVRAEVNRRLG